MINKRIANSFIPMIKDEFLQLCIRLADGQLFPLFRCNGPHNCQLELIPAHREQEKIELHIYQQRIDDQTKEPIEIGCLSLQNLPQSDDMEVRLFANLDINGILKVIIIHDSTQKTDSLTINLAEQAANITSPNKRKRRPAETIIPGVIIILAVLSLIVWFSFKVADWGQQTPVALPVSIIGDHVLHRT